MYNAKRVFDCFSSKRTATLLEIIARVSFTPPVWTSSLNWDPLSAPFSLYQDPPLCFVSHAHGYKNTKPDFTDSGPYYTRISYRLCPSWFTRTWILVALKYAVYAISLFVLWCENTQVPRRNFVVYPSIYCPNWSYLVNSMGASQDWLAVSLSRLRDEWSSG